MILTCVPYLKKINDVNNDCVLLFVIQPLIQIKLTQLFRDTKGHTYPILGPHIADLRATEGRV
jgi:hypothetical protein